MPPTGTARGLARSLVARGLDAAASGRLVLVAVEDAAAAGRALAAAPGPTVLVVAGARDAAMDAVLRAQDHVLVADTGEEGVAALAEARLAADGVRTARCAVPTGLARRVPALGTRAPVDLRAEHGQATILVLALLLAVVIGAVVLGAAARGVGAADERGRAADLAALAGARAMHDGFDRLFEPAALDGRANPRHLETRRVPRVGRRAAALATARRNGFAASAGDVPGRGLDGAGAHPCDVSAIRSPRRRRRGAGRERPPRRSSRRRRRATVSASAAAASTTARSRYRQGKPMRPDVALAFDRMEAAARRTAWR